MAPTAHAPMSSSPNLGAGSIDKRWRELQGSGSWAGLLDPLDSDLQASLIAYGELTEATYDGFNADANSADAGQCMFSKASLLAASGVSHPEYYTITKLLYATFNPLKESESESDSSSLVTKAMFVQPVTELRTESIWTSTNWIGYVAVATDKGVAALGRRDIVVAWRGTVKTAEFVKDGEFWLSSAATVLDSSDKFKNAKVHHGFLSVYTTATYLENHQVCPGQTDMVPIMTSARDQALAEVRALMEKHMHEVTSITVTGHSLGASLATLNAVDMVAHGVNVPPPPSKQPPCPVTAIVFASPRVGNDEFKRAFASFPELRALRVKNEYDIVQYCLPSCYVDETTATLAIDTTRSPYLCPQDLQEFQYHNLECYLHGVAGDHGAGRVFQLVVDRDLALVNKRTKALKEGYPVPAKWWVNLNKGLIKGVVGRCKLEFLKDDE